MHSQKFPGTAVSTSGVRTRSRRPGFGWAPKTDLVPQAVRVETRSPLGRRANPVPALLVLAGAILPLEVQVSIAGAKFTAGRIGIILLLVPALVTLSRGHRRTALCDLLVCATASWLIIAGINGVGLSALSSAAGGDALDFLGAYLVARAFSFGPTGLDSFVRVLKPVVITAVIIAMADSISGRYIAHDAMALIFDASEQPEVGYRGNMVRAASTFDHAILFGTFCAITAAILLYWEKRLVHRWLFVGLCFLGCILSRSSAALMSFAIVLITYTYDQLMKRYSWRWRVFWITLAMMICTFWLVANNPLGWVISHLTLDPQTGYFRMMIWEAAFIYIAQSPIMGYAYASFNTNLLKSVDSVWLVLTLRFGIPMTVLFGLANLAAIFPVNQTLKRAVTDSYTERMGRAFTLVILVFAFAGLTVHYWNYMWVFWGLCIGIRVSLREWPYEMWQDWGAERPR